MTWVNASYDSVRGPIVCDWNKDDGQFHLHVEIPVNTTAKVYVPATSAEAVTEGSQPAVAARGVQFLRIEDDMAVFAVQSGRYNFQSNALPMRKER